MNPSLSPLTNLPYLKNYTTNVLTTTKTHYAICYLSIAALLQGTSFLPTAVLDYLSKPNSATNFSRKLSLTPHP